MSSIPSITNSVFRIKFEFCSWGVTLSQISPGFYMSVVQAFWKHCNNKQFLLLPQCSLPVWKTCCPCHPFLNCFLQTLSVRKSLKFVVWERVKELRLVWNLNCCLQILSVWTFPNIFFFCLQMISGLQGVEFCHFCNEFLVQFWLITEGFWQHCEKRRKMLIANLISFFLGFLHGSGVKCMNYTLNAPGSNHTGSFGRVPWQDISQPQSKPENTWKCELSP